MCTTVHPVYKGETVLRWQKTDDGHRQRVPVPRPTAVGEYNKYMGGVDTSDQMLGTNSVHRRTRRWPMTVFQHLLDIAVTNSFIMHKELSMERQQKPMTRQAFQEELCTKLLGVPLTGSPKPPTQGKGRGQAWGGNSALSAKDAHPGCVRSARLGSVFSWTGTASETFTAAKKRLEMNSYNNL